MGPFVPHSSTGSVRTDDVDDVLLKVILSPHAASRFCFSSSEHLRSVS